MHGAFSTSGVQVATASIATVAAGAAVLSVATGTWHFPALSHVPAAPLPDVHVSPSGLLFVTVQAPVMQNPSSVPHGELHAANSSRVAHGSGSDVPVLSVAVALPPLVDGAAVEVALVLEVSEELVAASQVPTSSHVPVLPSVSLHAVPLGAGSTVHSPDIQKPSAAAHSVLHAENSSAVEQSVCAVTHPASASRSSAANGS